MSIHISQKGCQIPSVNSGRRIFLKNAAINGGMVLVGSASAQATAFSIDDGVLWTDEQEERLFREFLPPGVYHRRDAWIKRLFLYTMGMYRCKNPLDRLRSGGEVSGESVKTASLYTEPSLYVTAARMGDLLESPDPTPNDLKGKNLALWHFEFGVNLYYCRWGFGSAQGREVDRDIEREFVYTIFAATYYDYSGNYGNAEYAMRKANEFLTANPTKKEMMSKALMTRMAESMAVGDRGSADPRNAYNRLLVATWGVNWLANHYACQRKDRKYAYLADIITKHVVVPLQTFISPVGDHEHYVDLVVEMQSSETMMPELDNIAL